MEEGYRNGERMTTTIDSYIRSLTYDPRNLLSVQKDGNTQSLPVKDRQVSGNAVIVCTKKDCSLKKNLNGIAILQPTGGVIFPGALVYADQNLIEGRPTPIALHRGPITLTVDLPGLRDKPVPIPDPTNSSVQAYANEVLEEWNKNPASQGYVNAARSSLQLNTAYTSRQIALDLGFNAAWAGGEVSTKLGLSSNDERSVAMAFYRQVFYSVTMDTPPTPASVFASDVSLDQVSQVMNNDAVPAYVRSVDYGRILLITMETTALDTKANLEAALNQTITSGVKLGGSVDSKVERIIKNARFSVIALGGGAATAAEFTGGTDDLKLLSDYIKKDATYRRDNPGAPISYTVAYLKDNALAEMGFATDYTQTECIQYPNGYVKLRHDGGFVARWKVSWEEASQEGEYVSRSWSSGEQTAGYAHQVDLPGDARNVNIFAEAATGLAWDPWGDTINVTEDGPTNNTYRIYGTTLGRKHEVINSSLKG
jgi:thiol-activated cytolysin